MSVEPAPRVKAALELGGERREVEAAPSSDARLLSEKLMELKGLCMERLALFLLRDSASAGEDAILQDPLEASEDEEDDNAEELADDDNNSSNPPRPKKRK